jgi:hypothetical protein
MDSEIELTIHSQYIEPSSTSLRSAPGEDYDEASQAFSLPPADGGKDAWLLLAAGFMIEALIWGFPFTFGIFQEYYTHHEPFSSEASDVAVIGTSAIGIMYMSTIVLMPSYSYWPWLRRPSAFIG